MKITRKNLEKIIKEEIEDVIKTVSINQLEDTVTETNFTASYIPGLDPAPPEDPVLLLAFDISDGLKDDQLDNLWTQYGCGDTAIGAKPNVFTHKLCPAINTRKKYLSLKKKKNED